MQERDFKGVWIPKEVWLDSRLTALEKVILVEIDSLDIEDKGCFASNEYIATFCQCSIRKVTDAISKLLKIGYLYTQSFDGRQRVLKSTLANSARQTSKNCEADTQNLPQNNIDNNIDSIKEKPSKEKIDYESVRKAYNTICTSFPQCVSLSEARKKAIRARLNTYSMDDFIKMFQMAEASSFLKGKNDRNWTANFDWMIKDSNMAKILDGNYADKEKKQSGKFYNIIEHEHTAESDAALEKALYEAQKRRRKNGDS